MINVGTWNLENLFLPGDESGRPPDEETYAAKLNALATTINGLGADVLAVQEIGDSEALADLVGHIDGDWHTVLSEHPDSRGIPSRSCPGCPSSTPSTSLTSRHSCGRCRPVTATR